MLRHLRSRPFALIAVLSLIAGALVATTGVLASASGAGAPKGSPVGRSDIMSPQPGGLLFGGWAYDPNVPTTTVRVYVMVDGKAIIALAANQPRPDVARHYPGIGVKHGYHSFVPIPEGVHKICTVVKNIGPGANTPLACITRDMNYSPVGRVTSLVGAAGGISVAGWAYDTDSPKAPLTIQTSIDGHVYPLVAASPSAAAAASDKAAGTAHGFAAKYLTTQGIHQVCVTAINIGYGKNTRLDCGTINLNESPRGAIDVLGRSANKIAVSGWSFDPDAPTAPSTVVITVDGVQHGLVANQSRPDVGRTYPSAGSQHGFSAAFALSEGSHQVCVTVRNVSYGSDLVFPCRTVVLDFTPVAALTSLSATQTGVAVAGWASDPDTTAPIPVQVTVNGRLTTTLTAGGGGGAHSGHNLNLALTLKSGSYAICLIGVNVVYGTHNSKPACASIKLVLTPFGFFDSLGRAANPANLTISGWALDPDATGPSTVDVTLDGRAYGSAVASISRPDVAHYYPSFGPDHGYLVTLAADQGEHTVCVVARNVGAGPNVSQGCKVIDAVHPVAPSTPQQVSALAGYGGATLSWARPASDGGAPVASYRIVASPGGLGATVGAGTRSATLVGLKASTTYTFTVTASNVAGTSPAARSAAVKTQASPPPQTTPAPVSTSRYIRNISNGSAGELATMRREGAADAAANPSGHGYLILLDIGGQDHYDGGVVLSATTRFVPYATLVRDLQAYVDGYASAQRASAPITLALGTNNDMDVSSTTGAEWAAKVVNPVRGYAARYPGITVAGANDIEPGFSASYAQTRGWLLGYLGATTAPFVFNGSADGCSWTSTNSGCNNGWSMAGLYYLAVGASPARMLNLPQIYNNAMAGQWKYISLTGVGAGQPRINFAGTLTEWTACDQDSDCGSLTGHAAWAQMWANLQSDPRLRVSSLPYSTDLRIDS